MKHFEARILLVIFLFGYFMLSLGTSYAEEDVAMGPGKRDVVLTPADQMILEAINKLNDRIDKVNMTVMTEIGKLNDRIDKVNERIDKLWITMLGGFLGVMAFIGGIVFWERRTFLKMAREDCREEMAGDRKKLEAMLGATRKLSERYPELREVLSNFGLL